jgi:hypothetical protein
MILAVFWGLVLFFVVLPIAFYIVFAIVGTIIFSLGDFVNWLGRLRSAPSHK